MKINPLHLIDFYKADHRSQYPKGTNMIYSNFTPRSSSLSRRSRHGDGKVVFFGLQYFVKHYLIELMNETFFSQPKDRVVAAYKRRMDTSLGPDKITVEHIAALHDLGYLPVEIRALPEGTAVNSGIPVLTIHNTLPEFFWLTNYLETLMSCSLWKPTTSATTARQYRMLLEHYAEQTGGSKEFIPWQAHDFSFRGMSGVEDACVSGAGHLLSFTGTDTVPAIDFVETYYNADSTKELIGGSVPACYDDQTEILTNTGFKLFADLKPSDHVAQYSKEGEIKFVKPTSYYNAPYTGKMIKVSSTGYGYVDMLVTPNHRMVRVHSKTKKLSVFEAGDFSYRKRKGFSGNYGLVVAGLAYADSPELSFEDRLRIAFQADGSYPSRAHKYTGARTKRHPIRFGLKKARKKERLMALAQGGNIEIFHSEYESGYGNFWLKPKTRYRKDFEWVDLSKISATWANKFIEEISLWDGTVVKTRKNIIKYSSCEEECADKVQAIAILAGHKTHKTKNIDKRTNRRPNYTVIIQKNKTTISGDNVHREVIDYRGRVYCVSVPSGMLVVRRNGRVVICGNSEHSVMSMDGKEQEQDTYRRLLTEVYPSGIVSIVSDTYDFFAVLTNIVPRLKAEILAREGKFVVRPDSGDPVKIIVGDKGAEPGSPEHKGAIELLWDTFGGTTNAKGYRTLDPHVGLIYGDAITIERAEAIMEGLKAKGFASDNVVFGVGSYTYNYVTRDTHGFAMKATYGEVDGKPRLIYKAPKTDSKKNSARGILVVRNGNLEQSEDRADIEKGDMRAVFRDGKLLVDDSLAEIRKRLIVDKELINRL